LILSDTICLSSSHTLHTQITQGFGKNGIGSFKKLFLKIFKIVFFFYFMEHCKCLDIVSSLISCFFNYLLPPSISNTDPEMLAEKMGGDYLELFLASML